MNESLVLAEIFKELDTRNIQLIFLLMMHGEKYVLCMVWYQ